MERLLLLGALTYLLHSTLLLGAAWLVTKHFIRSERVREWTWRGALLGGLVTASFQLSAGVSPFAGTWQLADWSDGETALADPSSAPAPVAPLLEAQPRHTTHPRGHVHGHRHDEAPSLHVARVFPESIENAEAAAGAAHDATSGLPAWFGWRVGAAVLAALVLVRGLRARLALARTLRGARLLREGTLVDELQALCDRARVRRPIALSVAPGLEAPLATGILRPRIVVPERALQLAPDMRRAMLAHELAHLIRRDPLWLAVQQAVASLGFLQPLNRLALRELSRSAEYLCDAWAIRTTGDRVGLARCLAEVARWLVSDRRVAASCAMAELRSPLASRVKRILQEPTGARRPRFVLGTSLVALTWGGTVLAAPGFRFADQRAEVAEWRGSATPEAVPGEEVPASGNAFFLAGPDGLPMTRVHVPTDEANASLEELIGGIDLEISLLLHELDACAAEMRANGADDTSWQQLEDIHRRVRRVRASRERVQQVLTRLEGVLANGDDANTETIGEKR